MLAVVLILSVIVLPAMAADVQRRSHICPRCGGSGYYEWETTYDQPAYTVSSCDACPGQSHKHYDEVHRIWSRCENCLNDWIVSTYVRVFCMYDKGYVK